MYQRTVLTLAMLSVVGAANAAIYSYVDWTSVSAGTLTVGSESISATYTGTPVFVQYSGGTNYWNPSTPYISTEVSNAPGDSDIVAVSGGSSSPTQKFTFSKALVNPVIQIVSLGRDYQPVRLDFGSAPITVLSSGPGYWGGSSYTVSGSVLTGSEFHGTVQLTGTFSEIEIGTPDSEYWYGFQVGAAEAVPEPATMAALGFGALALLRRRRSR